MSEFNTPEQCAKCPYIKEVAAHHDLYRQELDGLSGLTPEMAQSAHEAMTGMLEHMGAQESDIQQIIGTVDDVRLGVIEQQMSIEGHLDTLAAYAVNKALGCPGTLTMRSTDQMGDTYKVTVCRSRDMPRGVSDDERAIVERT